MTESQLERFLDKLEEIRCGIIDVETEAQGIKVLVQQLITGNNTSVEEPPSPDGEIIPSCHTCSRLSMGIFCLMCKDLSNYHPE